MDYKLYESRRDFAVAHATASLRALSEKKGSLEEEQSGLEKEAQYYKTLVTQYEFLADQIGKGGRIVGEMRKAQEARFRRIDDIYTEIAKLDNDIAFWEALIEDAKTWSL